MPISDQPPIVAIGGIAAAPGQQGLAAALAGIQQQLAVMNAGIQQQFTAMNNRLDTMQNEMLRGRNGSATQPLHTLVIPTNALNQPLPAGMWVPQTWEELFSITGVRATALLGYYAPNIPVPPQIRQRRLMVADFLGVRLL